ncbi:hypothetical protein SAMD00019534_080490 [Acytostelium subglobosum LB1]|uniref:hypothetical protein n=1 Tax=Acytostelium subglobosum LB1 TaxID=1410327 RepID=UPI0006451997|nr:hypothetical protein SAMD00019534_080490 [Acytostelium subglobosum LB1]GAM24874.1 hypothetical protein SAMD00019534_080490 [Acytostelium subglobosum LB1]|eukprot:XP_012751963.1 hypothetical protein SAMD00019534_080490 [Acytostelium subglobosum LB1]
MSYVSGSQTNWDVIQLDSFTGWINSHLQERSLAVHNLSTDFSDGVLLINLLEIISGKKVVRYVRHPKFLQHKIDNIVIALGFMEKVFGIKVVGINAKDIVDGNLKQIMGISFLLIQKIRSNALLASQAEAEADASSTASTTSQLPHQQQPSLAIFANKSTSVTTNNDDVSYMSRYSLAPTTTLQPLTATGATSQREAIKQSKSMSEMVSSPDVRVDRGIIRKIKSGSLMIPMGTFEFAGHVYSVRLLVKAQAVIRGWLCRLRWRELITKYRLRLRDYEAHFTTNAKAYRGLTKVQARTKGRMERKRLFKQYPLFRRNEIIKEILATEKKYVHCLSVLIECYLHECEKLLTQQQVRQIFSQVSVVYNVNVKLLGKMENRFSSGKETTMGMIFSEMTEYFKVYTIYVNNYNAAITCITECRAQNEKFVKLLETNRASEKCMGLDLASLLIMPIQRIPRYVMLLQDLVKFTNESHADYENLSVALKKMKDVAEYVNEKKREAENLIQVLKIQNNLVGMTENLAEPHRRYVRKGPLTCLDEKGNSKIYFFFLFNDLLIKTENKSLAKSLKETKNQRNTQTIEEGKFKFVLSYKLGRASLIDLGDSPLPFSFRLVDIEVNGGENSTGIMTTSITLSASTLTEKMIWVSDIDESISQLLEKQRSKLRSLVTDYEELTSLPFEGAVTEPEKAGVIRKQFNEMEWKSKQFYLKQCALYYHDIDEPKKMKCINLLLSSVKLVQQAVDHPHCFQLMTPQRIYLFSCEDLVTVLHWISLIRRSIGKRLESLDLQHQLAAAQAKTQESALNCADCGATEVSWVSTTYGVALCVDCSSIHKRFPNGVSQLKSLRGLSSSLTDGVADILKSIDNNKANQKYEKNVPSHLLRPSSRDSYELRKTWIMSKYLQIMPSDVVPTSEPSSALVDAPAVQDKQAEVVADVQKVEPVPTTVDIVVSADEAHASALQQDQQQQQSDKQAQTQQSQTQQDTTTSTTTTMSADGEMMDANGSTWKLGSHVPPPYERKKSVFLDKPRKEIRREMDGYLMKAGSSSKSPNWKRYIFFYKDGVLNYYKSEKKMKKPRATIDLRMFYSLIVEPKPKQPFAFTLVTNSRLYTFAAEKKEDLEAWVEVLSVGSKNMNVVSNK